MELPLEIIIGVKERYDSVGSAVEDVAARASASAEADRLCYEAEYPSGARGDLMSLCVSVDSKFGVWLGFIGGDKKKLQRLKAVKIEKLEAWKQASAEKQRREKDLDRFISLYLSSIDPEYKELMERFAAIEELFGPVDRFRALFYEADQVTINQRREIGKILLGQKLIELGTEFLTVKRAVMSYLSAAGPESEAGIRNDLQAAYEAVAKNWGSWGKPGTISDACSDYSRLCVSVYNLCDIVEKHRDALDTKMRAQINATEEACLKES